MHPPSDKTPLAERLTLAVKTRDIAAARNVFETAFWSGAEPVADWHHLLTAALLQDKPMIRLLATHGDWDHLLGRMAFPGAALGCAETTAARLKGEMGAAVRELKRVA